MSSNVLSTTSSDTAPSIGSIGVRNTQINEKEGVKLSDHQRLLVGSVLDLFEGNPTLKHLSLWDREATFQDPLTISVGFHKYAAQWYGLPALFWPIKLQSHVVTSAGNPIEIKTSNKYIVKGIKTEHVIDSIIAVHVQEDGKISKVEDKWNGKLPDGAISQAFRKLNAVTVPAFVKVPKTEEEDMKMQRQRDASTA